MSLSNSALSAFALPLLFVLPGVTVVAVAVALNWGR